MVDHAPVKDRQLRDLEPDVAMQLFSPSAVTAFVDAAARVGVSLPATVVSVDGAPRNRDLVDFVRSLLEAKP